MNLFKINGIVGKRAPRAHDLICKQLQFVNLKAVESVVASYDPFDPSSLSTRKFLTYLWKKDVLYSNPDFNNIKTVVKCDRSEPTVAFKLGKNVVFKCTNLTTLEMVELYNKYVTPAAPVEEKTRETLTTKAMKKQSRY